MKFLEAMELIQYLYKLMEVGNRVQVPKEKLNEFRSVLSQLLLLLGEDTTMMLNAVIEDLLTAASAADKVEMTALPDSMKQAIGQGLAKVKQGVAELAFSYFTFNDFEPTKEIIPLMREVVAQHYGGVDID